MTAVVTLVDVSSKRSSAADLDGMHHTKLFSGYRRAKTAAVRLPMLVENIRYFKTRFCHL
jgi:hypothetical protein